MIGIKILKYFLPFLLAFLAGMRFVNYSEIINSAISVSLFLIVHFITNIEHKNNNNFIFFGIAIFIIYDIRQTAFLGSHLIPFCFSSALFSYLTNKKKISHKVLTIICCVIYLIGCSFTSFFVSTYFDFEKLATELLLLVVVFVVLTLYQLKLNKRNEINYLQI